MTYDPEDFLTHVRPEKHLIKTANEEGIKVKGAGTISISKNIKIKN